VSLIDVSRAEATVHRAWFGMDYEISVVEKEAQIRNG
jgi:hypothetical protein